MCILFEQHKYPKGAVEGCLWDGISADPDGTVTIDYVGYFYNEKENRCVLILPRVLLEDVTIQGVKQERVFIERDAAGNVQSPGVLPEDVIDPEAKKPNGEYRLSVEQRRFIREFAVWVYRALELYWKGICDEKGVDGERKRRGVLRKLVPIMGRGALRKSHTLLDVILAMREFRRENENYFIRVLRERTSGQNKINWTRTIARSPMTLTEAGPMYARPVNRCREIDFDDELFTIFYSVLRHVHEEYGFGELRNPGFSLLTPVQFRRYLGGFGVIRLKQIRGRYFSDQALRMWDLCFSFFEHQHEIRVHANRQEYLLARKFEVVFEAMIDALIGDPRSMIPEGLKDQDDGKRVDHMYRYAGLEDVDADGGVEKSVYYIGDSKYYKRRDKISGRSEAVYKQFTYARNVIQWNLDLFLDAEEKGEIAPGTKVHKGERRLRNEATEGYAVIPNFFISGRIENDLRYDHRDVKPVKAEDGKRKEYFARQFENRLFDRDTFLIAHYDVNFLYVLSLYAKNNAAKRKAWRDYVRNEFRNRIRTMLQENYEFYAMTPRGETDPEAFFRENFKEVIGRVFDPYGKRNGFDYYSVAVRKSDATHDFSAENEALLGLLETKFKIKPCDLGVKPETVAGLEGEARRVTVPIADDRRTFHWLENYKDADIVLGFCKGDDHLKWMLGRDGGKESDMYNLRADKDRAGSVNVRDPKTRNAKFLILYFASSEEDNKCRVFRISKGVTKGREWLLDTGYPHDRATEATAGKRYYCYYLDEEVSLGELAIGQLLIMKRLERKEQYHAGEPVFVKGAEVLAVRINPPNA